MGKRVVGGGGGSRWIRGLVEGGTHGESSRVSLNLVTIAHELGGGGYLELG